jgi:putative transposase
MVRCGVVLHPREWEWVGLYEIMGSRRSYRLLDLEQLCWRLCAQGWEEVRQNLAMALEDRMVRDDLKRTAYWTECLAVGSPSFVEQVQPLILSRRETEIEEVTANVWTLSETAVPYGQKTGAKNASKAVN